MQNDDASRAFSLKIKNWGTKKFLKNLLGYSITLRPPQSRALWLYVLYDLYLIPEPCYITPQKDMYYMYIVQPPSPMQNYYLLVDKNEL